MSTRIVILGGGFAGAYCAQALERSSGRTDLDVQLVDRQNFLTFYPLLMEAGTGSLEPRHTVVPLRNFLRRTRFRMGEIESVDLEHQRVEFLLGDGKTRQTLAFDHLVLATGAVTSLPDVPGLKDYGFQMKTLADAIALRDRAIRMLELADALEDPAERRKLLHFVVVGGNFTGVEVAGELDVFIKQASRAYRRVDEKDCKVTLVELSERILSSLDEELADYAVRVMRSRGMDVRLGDSVSEVKSNEVLLNSGGTIRMSSCVWCAGIAPSPLISRLGLPTDEQGWVQCEPDMRVKGFENVWAIGDCAVNPDPAGDAYPATAQHAVRQGAQLAGNLARAARGEPTRECRISSSGELAALGCRTGVARVFGLKLSGFAAWFLWRTVYLMKMPGFARKLRVALDWTMDMFFGRDFAQLGVHRERR